MATRTTTAAKTRAALTKRTAASTKAATETGPRFLRKTLVRGEPSRLVVMDAAIPARTRSSASPKKTATDAASTAPGPRNQPDPEPSSNDSGDGDGSASEASADGDDAGAQGGGDDGGAPSEDGGESSDDGGASSNADGASSDGGSVLSDDENALSDDTGVSSDGDDGSSGKRGGRGTNDAKTKSAKAYGGLDAIVRSLKEGGKPNLKQIAVTQFSGRTAPGDFDSNVRTWWAEFNNQMLGAQLRDNHRWNEVIKCSFLQASLTGDAAKWFNRVWQSKPRMSLQTAGERLIAQFSTKVDQEDIRDYIKRSKKKPEESYEMFSQRLQNMADSLPHGIKRTENAYLAMSVFAKAACPARADQLKYYVASRASKYKPLVLLNKLVQLVGQLDNTDGVADDADPPAKRVKGVSGQTVKPLAAMATLVDRKRKKVHTASTQPSKYGPFVQPQWVSENTVCYKCKGRGHIGRDPACPKYSTPLGAAATKATTEDAM